MLTEALRLLRLNGGGNRKEEVVLVEEGVRLTGLPRRRPPFSICAEEVLVTLSGPALGAASWWSPWLLGMSMTEVLSPEGSWGEYSDGNSRWRAS